MQLIEVRQGDSPLVLGLPHTGIWVPDGIEAELNENGLALADTDWHIDDLYSDLVPDLTTVRTNVHRYAIDVNRDPSGVSLYPGQHTTGLCPLTDFDGRPIYMPGREPGAGEIARRLAAYHAPYHAALESELRRLRSIHGFAILYDCHSIRSAIPFLFDGILPDFNIGTNSGASCAPSIETAVAKECRIATGYSSVLNGRFKGGWTTRHYGQPATGFHAIQMELAQSTYMQECPPWDYDAARAAKLQHHLRSILRTLSDWSPQ